MNDTEAKKAMTGFLGELEDDLLEAIDAMKGAPANALHAANTAELHVRQLLEKSESEGPDVERFKAVVEATGNLVSYAKDLLEKAGEFKAAVEILDSVVFSVEASQAGGVLCW